MQQYALRSTWQDGPDERSEQSITTHAGNRRGTLDNRWMLHWHIVEETNASLLVVIRELRDAAKAADGNNNPGTVDLFSQNGPDPLKAVWWFKSRCSSCFGGFLKVFFCRE